MHLFAAGSPIDLAIGQVLVPVLEEGGPWTRW
jgi:hypothetical protein